jgi:hypothetical protein
MPILKTLATGLAGRTAARRLSRAIPNPMLRYAVVTAATAMAPMVARRFSAAMQRRKLARTERRLALA